MGKRNIRISTYDIAWYLKDDKNSDELPIGGNFNYTFGVMHSTKDGKITFIEDNHYILEENWEMIKQDKRFEEVCTFEDYQTQKSFEGNFIDALKYIEKRIKKNLEEKGY